MVGWDSCSFGSLTVGEGHSGKSSGFSSLLTANTLLHTPHVSGLNFDLFACPLKIFLDAVPSFQFPFSTHAWSFLAIPSIWRPWSVPRIYVDTHIHVYTNIHILFLYICTHPYIYTSIHIYIHAYIQIQIYIFTNIHLYKYTFLQIHIYTNIHVYKFTCIQIYIYTNIHSYIHTYNYWPFVKIIK